MDVGELPSCPLVIIVRCRGMKLVLNKDKLGWSCFNFFFLTRSTWERDLRSTGLAHNASRKQQSCIPTQRSWPGRIGSISHVAKVAVYLLRDPLRSILRQLVKIAR